MKNLIIFLLILIPNIGWADQFSPYIYITNVEKQHNRQYSGVVYASDENSYYILTCWHGTSGLEERYINLHSNVIGQDSKIALIAFKSTIIKSDEDKDLSVLSFPKVDMVTIDPLYIAREQPDPGTEMIGYGYSSVPTLIANPIRVKSYGEYSSQQGSPLLEFAGQPISGMSGGPATLNNMIYGIQSAGNNRVLYCPSSEILKFLGN